MAFSSAGRKKLAGQVAFLLLDIVVLALSARVNRFQDFYYIADLFPLALSIISLVIVSLLLVLDFAIEKSYTSRSQVDIGVFGVLSIFWLAFNAFSTSRWRLIPFNCDAIPKDFLDERIWCKDLQALKVSVWLTFVVCIGIALFTLRYALSQYNQGNTHIFQMPLSRYRPEFRPNENASRGSEFLQFEKFY